MDADHGSLAHQPNIEIVYDFIDTMCLKSAVELAIPDKVSSHDQPITLPELVSALNIHPKKASNLHQVLRYLAGVGLLSKTKLQEEDAYVLAPSSKLLLADIDSKISAAICSSPSALGPLHHVLTQVWENIGNSLLSEDATTPFEYVHGTHFWDYLKNNPEGQIFDAAMKSDSKLFIETALPECFPAFKGLECLVDVGGGTGALANSISQAFPELKCTVLDLPNVVNNLPPQASYKHINYVGGDMFRSIPPADAILMKCVLHDWRDEECILILKNCKDAISHKGRQGKLIIMDTVMNEEMDEPEISKMKLVFDMTMMILSNGMERTEKEWKLLFVKAGFSHYKITTLPGIRSLIEVFP